MTVGESIAGAIGLVAAIVIVREIKRARQAIRDGRCITCGAPASDGECDECWNDRASTGK